MPCDFNIHDDRNTLPFHCELSILTVTGSASFP